MKGKRLKHTIHLMLCRNDKQRSDYLKSNDVFFHMGENVSLNMKILPLYSKLISFGNNIKVASGVTFITHDVMEMVFNRCSDYTYTENVGCIDIRDNVFIGAKSILLPNITIGPNSIVAAGAVVTKDVPPGEIWGGCPARKIGQFDDYLNKYKRVCEKKKRFDEVLGEDLSEQRINQEWEYFRKKRRSNSRQIDD